MSGNICRCGAYRGITEAVLDAHEALAGAAQEDAA
jgi:xanthine dehydrogenase YagT iron-sulfur-binding subunit